MEWNGALVGVRSPWPLLTTTVVQIQQRAVQQYSSTAVQQYSSTAPAGQQYSSAFTRHTPSGGRRICCYLMPAHWWNRQRGYLRRGGYSRARRKLAAGEAERWLAFLWGSLEPDGDPSFPRGQYPLAGSAGTGSALEEGPLCAAAEEAVLLRSGRPLIEWHRLHET